MGITLTLGMKKKIQKLKEVKNTCMESSLDELQHMKSLSKKLADTSSDELFTNYCEHNAANTTCTTIDFHHYTINNDPAPSTPNTGLH